MSERLLEAITLDLNDPFESALISIVATKRKKSSDYANSVDIFSNFVDSAAQLNLTAGHSVEILIATKQGRLKNLLPKMWMDTVEAPVNESIEDTLLDRAVYSAIALAMYRGNLYVRNT